MKNIANISLPEKQKGGAFNASHILLCANRLVEIPSEYLSKTPLFQKVISLDKSKQDLLMHSTLAVAGASMVLAAIFSIASSGGSVNETIEYISHISQNFNDVSSLGDIYDTLALAIDVAKEQAPESFIRVWGTMSTGALNCARNLTQIWYLRPRKHEDIDLSKPENRQKRRKKQAVSNFWSGVTNIPQLLEGLKLFEPVRIVASGSAVTAYFLRSKNYDGSYNDHLQNNDNDSGHKINKDVPSNLMIYRGLGQTTLSIELFKEFGLAAGAFITLAGLAQTFGAVVMKYSDKSYNDILHYRNSHDFS